MSKLLSEYVGNSIHLITQYLEGLKTVVMFAFSRDAMHCNAVKLRMYFSFMLF